MFTTAEAAARLGLSQVGIRRHIEKGRIAARLATPNELAALLSEGRIKSVPPTGVRLIEESALEAFSKPAVGRPKKSPDITP